MSDKSLLEDPRLLRDQFLQYRKETADCREKLKRDGIISGADYWELIVSKYHDRPAVLQVDDGVVKLTKDCYTYGELDSLANQIANFFLQKGLKSGDVVCLLMENRPQFYSYIFGLAKIGVCVPLLNTNLKGEALAHCVASVNANFLIISSTLYANWESLSVGNNPDSTLCENIPFVVDRPNTQDSLITSRGVIPDFDFVDIQLKFISASAPSRQHRAAVQPRDPMFCIYTSGTTGKPKAAKFSHARMIGAGVTWCGPSLLNNLDKYYISLPLYHGNALAVSSSPCFWSGACVLLRSKFSASKFFSDVRKYGTTKAAYIGELWSYIHSLPDDIISSEFSENDSFSPLKVIIGNGLRADLWEKTVSKFKIHRVVEHYGSTEMPGAAVLNWANQPGSCGYYPPDLRALEGNDAVFSYNTDQNCVERDPITGLCIECQDGEIGELLMRLPDGKYDGYFNNLGATMKKVYKNVRSPGDSWWSSGDLLKIEKDGFYYFIDRAGDSYRWKGENVSTTEVAQYISKYGFFLEVNVYGVEVIGNYGKAGMACVQLSRSSDFHDSGFWKNLYIFLHHTLPPYAIPLFLRILPEGAENEKTSTLKFQKTRYVQEAFHLHKVPPEHRLLFRDERDSVKTFVPLTFDIYTDLMNGRFRL